MDIRFLYFVKNSYILINSTVCLPDVLLAYECDGVLRELLARILVADEDFFAAFFSGWMDP